MSWWRKLFGMTSSGQRNRSVMLQEWNKVWQEAALQAIAAGLTSNSQVANYSIDKACKHIMYKYGLSRQEVMSISQEAIKTGVGSILGRAR